MNNPGIDLHTHTTASDGSLSPTELIEKASALGLAAFAITDHDTVGGLAEGIDAARRCKLALITGVELSVEDSIGRFHMLGYGFDPADTALETALAELRALRKERNEAIMAKSHALGLPIEWSDVLRHVGDGGEVVGRPHIAAALVEKGVVATIQEAFDKYLATGQPLYTPKDGLTPKRAASLLHATGGIAVMAHPGLSRWREPDALVERLRGLKDDAGLDGIEAYYSQHTPDQTREYLRIASDLDLVVTGGSDFHGTPKPKVILGSVLQPTGEPAPASLLTHLPRPVA